MKIVVKKRDRWWKVFCQECQIEWRFNNWTPSTYRRSPYGDMGAHHGLLAHIKMHNKMEDRIAQRGRLRIV